MSTGAIIARRKGEGFSGVHRDSDGYPEELGRSLWADYHHRFNEDVNALLGYVLGSEPSDLRSLYGGEYTYVLDDLGMTITDSSTAYLDGWGYRTRVLWNAPEPRWESLRWTSVRGVWSAEEVAEAARQGNGA